MNDERFERLIARSLKSIERRMWNDRSKTDRAKREPYESFREKLFAAYAAKANALSSRQMVELLADASNKN